MVGWQGVGASERRPKAAASEVQGTFVGRVGFGLGSCATQSAAHKSICSNRNRKRNGVHSTFLDSYDFGWFRDHRVGRLRFKPVISKPPKFEQFRWFCDNRFGRRAYGPVIPKPCVCKWFLRFRLESNRILPTTIYGNMLDSEKI